MKKLKKYVIYMKKFGKTYVIYIKKLKRDLTHKHLKYWLFQGTLNHQATIPCCVKGVQNTLFHHFVLTV